MDHFHGPVSVHESMSAGLLIFPTQSIQKKDYPVIPSAPEHFHDEICILSQSLWRMGKGPDNQSTQVSVLFFSLHRLVVWCFQAWTTCAVWFRTANKERFQRSSLTSLWKKNIYRVQSSLLWVVSTLIRWLDKWQTNLEYGPKTGVDATLKFWNICKGYHGCDVATKVACCGGQHLYRTYDVQKSEGWLTFKKPLLQN